MAGDSFIGMGSWQFDSFIGQGDHLAQCNVPTDVAALQVPICKTPSFFERFPYVCPEPVLAKRSHLYISGSKSSESGEPSSVEVDVRKIVHHLCEKRTFYVNFLSVLM